MSLGDVDASSKRKGLVGWIHNKNCMNEDFQESYKVKGIGFEH